MQVNFFDADTLVAHGLDSRDVIHQRGELAFMQSQDAVLNVLRAHPVVGPHHRNHGDVDFRKNVDGHAQCGAHSHQRNQDKHRHDGVGALQRNFDNGHFLLRTPLALRQHRQLRPRIGMQLGHDATYVVFDGSLGEK
jgi:hypothetical protein